MKVTVRYFAAFREATGIGEETVDTAATTPAALFGECAERHAGLRQYASSMVAVNDEMAGWEDPIGEGDAVLFFPPVAGG